MAKDSSPSLFQSLMSMADAAMGAAVLIGLGAWGGTWLDGHFDTRPWWTISLSLLGAFLGMTRMMMKALALNKAESTQGTKAAPQASKEDATDEDEA